MSDLGLISAIFRIKLYTNNILAKFCRNEEICVWENEMKKLYFGEILPLGVTHLAQGDVLRRKGERKAGKLKW